MIPLLAAVLVLHPVVAEAGPLRLAAGAEPPIDVEWLVDGQSVGTTHGHEALEVTVTPGLHEVRAASQADHPWTALARVDAPTSGLAYVTAWSASAPGEAPRPIPSSWLAPVAVALAGALRRLSKGP